MAASSRPLAVVTGASTGIGYELARCCSEKKFSLVVAADEEEIDMAAASLRANAEGVDAVKCDLATTEGVDGLLSVIGERPVDVLIANAGRGLGHAFLDQDWNDIRRVLDTNVTGTIYLLHAVGRRMRDQRRGRILITGSIAGFMPGTYQAAYNGTKALLDSFAAALRAELDGSGVSVTCLMPGPTETDFFARADMLDTKVATGRKQSAAEVAKLGFEAMMRGDGQIITGVKNKLQVAFAHVAPSRVLASMHAGMAAPGTANKA